MLSGEMDDELSAGKGPPTRNVWRPKTAKRVSPANQDGPDPELALKLEKRQQRIAAGGAASAGQKPLAAGAAPARDEAGARENRARPSSRATEHRASPASQDGQDSELKLKFEKRQQRQARAAAEGTSGGAEPGPAAAGAIKGPAPVPYAAGARAREVSGMDASSGGSTGAGAKMPKEIFPLVRREEGSDVTWGADGGHALVGAEGVSTSGTRALAGVVEGEVGDYRPVADDGDEDGFVKVESEEAAVLVSCPQPRHPRLLMNKTFYSCCANLSRFRQTLPGSVESIVAGVSLNLRVGGTRIVFNSETQCAARFVGPLPLPRTAKQVLAKSTSDGGWSTLAKS